MNFYKQLPKIEEKPIEKTSKKKFYFIGAMIIFGILFLIALFVFVIPILKEKVGIETSVDFDKNTVSLVKENIDKSEILFELSDVIEETQTEFNILVYKQNGDTKLVLDMTDKNSQLSKDLIKLLVKNLLNIDNLKSLNDPTELSPITDSIEVNYNDLSNNQTKITKNLINTLDPSYAKKIKKITVVKNIKEFCKDKDSKECNVCNGKCGGWIYKNTIVVTYSDSKSCGISKKYINESIYEDSCLKLTLCHEIVHSKFGHAGDWFSPIHQKIFKLAHEEVCYKK